MHALSVDRPARCNDCAPDLKVLPVEGPGAELVYVDAIEAAHVDGEHIVPVFSLAARERLDTARAAEHVMDDVLVEPVFADRIQAAQQFELRGLHKCEPEAVLGADGAVAGDGLGGVGGCLISHPTAVAATRVGLSIGHVAPPLLEQLTQGGRSLTRLKSAIRRAPQAWGHATFRNAPSGSTEQARHLTQHGVNQNEDGTYSWKFDNYVRSWPPYDMTTHDVEGGLWARITCPTLLVYGRESWTSNPAEDGRAKDFKTAEIVTFEGAGHWVHHDKLVEFLALTRRFLAA
jgi:pimeloyl-ACP methyl ester carboxylesterase